MSSTEIAQMVDIAKNAMTGVAATVAAIVAVMGLRTWKRQLLGNAKYDLSRRLLRATYRLREAIRGVRNPFMSASELNSALNAAGQVGNPLPNDRAEGLAYEARWRKVADAQLEFEAEVLEAEVLWGVGIRQRAGSVSTCTGELHFALGQYLSIRRRPPDADREERLTNIIYDSGEASSEFSNRLTAAIAEVEAEIRPHLKL